MSLVRCLDPDTPREDETVSWEGQEDIDGIFIGESSIGIEHWAGYLQFVHYDTE